MGPDSFPKDRIIILAPGGPNAKTVKDVLERSGFFCLSTDNINEFCAYLAQETGAAIILDEVLTEANIAAVRDTLQQQPSWSDIPFILLTRQSPLDISALDVFGTRKNINVLELPIRTASLIGLVKSSLQTRRRQYQNRDLIDELQHTKAQLLDIKDVLENKNREMESIIGIVSHDLRAPLVNIQGFSNELQMDFKAVDTLLAEVPVEQQVQAQLDILLHQNIPEYLQYIQTSSDAMNKLVVTLLEVARAGFMPIKPEPLDMHLLVKQIIASIEILIKQAGASYYIDDMPACRADRTQVEQIFRNLLDNAIKYLDPNRTGQICMGGTLQADSALYWVADNGIGISPEHQEKIFEPYYQLKEKASGGMGLGLVTVKRMVEHNGGKIWVISEKNKGSTFYVALQQEPLQIE